MHPRRHMRWGVGFTLVLGTLLLRAVVSAGPSPAERPKVNPDKLTLTISSDKEVYALGQLPKLCATLTNHTGSRILIATPLDGSDRGRFPQLRFDVTPPAGTAPPDPIGICGNTNPISEGCFQTLGDGQTVDLLRDQTPFSLHYETQRGAGEYRVRATYSTNSTDINKWLGGPLSEEIATPLARKIQPLLNRVPLFDVSSNTIVLRYEDPWKTPEAALRQGTLNECRFALSRLQRDGLKSESVQAIVEAIDRYYKHGDEEYLSFVRLAMPLVAEKGDKDALTRLWPRVVAERQTRGAQMFYVDDNGLELVRLVVRLPGPEREERLRYLLEWRYMYRMGQRTVPLDQRVMQVVCDTTGDDVGRVLLDLYHDAVKRGGLDRKSFDVMKAELVKRGLLSAEESATAVAYGTHRITLSP